MDKQEDDVIELTDTSQKPGHYRDLLAHLLDAAASYPKVEKLLYLRLKIKYGTL